MFWSLFTALALWTWANSSYELISSWNEDDVVSRPLNILSRCMLNWPLIACKQNLTVDLRKICKLKGKSFSSSVDGRHGDYACAMMHSAHASSSQLITVAYTMSSSIWFEINSTIHHNNFHSIRLILCFWSQCCCIGIIVMKAMFCFRYV